MLGGNVPLLVGGLHLGDEVGAFALQDHVAHDALRQVELGGDVGRLLQQVLRRAHLLLPLVEPEQIVDRLARVGAAPARALHDRFAHRGRRVVGGDQREAAIDPILGRLLRLHLQVERHQVRRVGELRVARRHIGRRLQHGRLRLRAGRRRRSRRHGWRGPGSARGCRGAAIGRRWSRRGRSSRRGASRRLRRTARQRHRELLRGVRLPEVEEISEAWHGYCLGTGWNGWRRAFAAR